MNIEESRKLIEKELKICQMIKGISITTVGTWHWDLVLYFDKNTSLGKELFCHSLKFKTNFEGLLISVDFPCNYPQSLPKFKLLKPRLMYLTGNVDSTGNFVGLELENKNIIGMIDEIRKSIINNKGSIDLRVNGNYQSIKSLQDEEKQIQYELIKDKIPTINNYNKKLRVIESTKYQENGDTIILPSSSRDELKNAKKPLLFEMKLNHKRLYGGSGYREMEYTAPKGCIILPQWMMASLFVKEGQLIDVRSVSLPKGTFCKVQPQSKEFYKIKDHKIALEKMFSNFKTLCEGQFVPLVDDKKVYWIEILELQPEKAVSIDPGRDKYLDLVIDFVPAVDFDDSVQLPNEDQDTKIELPPTSPLPGKKLGSSENIFDDQSKLCENCDKMIPKDKITIHEIHCLKNIYKCIDCKKKMEMIEKSSHEFLFHRKILCECGQEIQKDLLRKHKIEKCPERIKICSYCHNKVNQSQKEEHEKNCEKNNEKIK